MAIRVFLLLAGLVLASAQCQSTFFAAPSVELSEDKKAYLEWPADPELAEEIAQEFCELNLPTGAAYPPTVGTYKKAFADLTAKLPITQLSDPLGYNLTVCEGAGCSIFGIIECVPKGAAPCQPDGQGNIGRGNTGQNNIGNGNQGAGNYGNNNSGSGNVGDHNAGTGNLGNDNSGTGNIGSKNSGSGNVCNDISESGITFAACPPANRGPYIPDLE
ncbi:hypothetical protein N2152v2_010589 [Parachlorella kessleri]